MQNEKLNKMVMCNQFWIVMQFYWNANCEHWNWILAHLSSSKTMYWNTEREVLSSKFRVSGYTLLAVSYEF